MQQVKFIRDELRKKHLKEVQYVSFCFFFFELSITQARQWLTVVVTQLLCALLVITISVPYTIGGFPLTINFAIANFVNLILRAVSTAKSMLYKKYFAIKIFANTPKYAKFMKIVVYKKNRPQ